MIVLDTNVVSEILKPLPDPGVLTWVDAQIDPAIASPTLAELMLGAKRLPLGSRRTGLLTAIDRLISDVFAHRILPLDGSAAVAYGAISAHRASRGRPIHTVDGLIAGICASEDLPLATRNVRDFALTGIDVIDPWNPHLPSTAGYDHDDQDDPTPSPAPEPG